MGVNLASLADVQEWLTTSSQGAPYPSAASALLTRLLGNASDFVYHELERVLAPATYSDRLSGYGTSRLWLRNRPIISVISLTVDGCVVPAQTSIPFGYGYVVSEDELALIGGAFSAGLQNVQVTYTAGLQVTGEAQTVPSSGQYQINASSLAKAWISDVGVTLASGTPLFSVSGAPASGQYQVTLNSGVPTYVFNVAQAGAAVLISYGWVWSDLRQAVIELVGETYKRRTRIGDNSQNTGNGMVTSFSTKDMNDYIKSVIANHKNVVPV